MDDKVLSIFPPLTIAQKNDSALLPIVPLYSGKKVYCNFVYHNDKFHNSIAANPRNEYRLYLNNELENGRRYFETGDIMVLRQAEIEDEGPQTVYLMDLVKDKESALYKFLDKTISDSSIRGGHGIYEGRISEFESKIESVLCVCDSAVAIDETVTKRIAENESAAIASLFNASTFRDFVMVGYDNLRAITGTVIRYEGYMNLEAAHIRPKSHGGLYLPNNGIVMCRDLHWAFDKGFFSINDDYQIIVHDKTTSDYLRSFQGKRIRVPRNPFFMPDKANLKYHRENIFGLFLTTGRI